jgi:thiol-disulfide isomerase/thioredoxin
MRTLFLGKIGILASLSLAIAFPAVCDERNSSGQAHASSQERRLEPIDETGLKRLLEAHKGQVVMLNFWATWCEPCREEFPELLRVYEDYHQRGVILILLSLDEPDQLEAAEHFLEEHKVGFTSYIRSEEDIDPVVSLVDPEWVGALPSTFLFDRKGKRAETLLGHKDYETFVKFLEPLINARD